MTMASRRSERRAVGAAAPTGDWRKRGTFLPLVEEIEREGGGTGLSGAAFHAGALVRSMRKTGHLSQAVLADRLRMSQARISEIEAGVGVRGPSWTLMKRIAEACGAVILVRQGETEIQVDAGLAAESQAERADDVAIAVED